MCTFHTCYVMAVSFEKNEKFSSLSELESKIIQYQKKNYVDLYKRDSRTIDSAIKKKSISADKVPSEEFKKKLKYYEIRYTCIHGGRKHNSVSTGKRKTSTFRDGCPFNLVLRLSEDGMSLKVRDVIAEHNHLATEETFKFYPNQRRLSCDQRSYAQKQLEMNVNKKKLQHELEADTGKPVLLKDLSNIITTVKKLDSVTRNDLDACVDELRRVHKCEVDISKTQENDFCGIFIQDQKMKQTFSAFPEILFLDATYKLLELQFPVYVFACEDSNGDTHIVGVGALYEENAPSVKWLVETFQKHNPEISTTRLVMADKDINERDVIKEILPHVKVMICLFHSLKTFKREINTEEMNITIAEKNTCLEFISQMAYSNNENEYTGVYREFSVYAPPPVKQYFDNNWQ
jgi:zinc finger SWIM domain-containing protein 3